MGLQDRGLNIRRVPRHDTESIRRHAVLAEQWRDYRPGDRVRTVDGILGRVEAVYDGFAPGNEEYEVVLDRGLGGGRYVSGQLSSIPQTLASDHLASDDYPELGTLLYDRPDPARHTAEYQWGSGSRGYDDEDRPYAHYSDEELQAERAAVTRDVEQYRGQGREIPSRLRGWHSDLDIEHEHRLGI